VAAGLSLALAVGALLALDLRLHQRFEQAAGLNIRGYRGPVVGKKRTGERRIVVLGGSTALGYGVPPAQSFPAFLERRLNASRVFQARHGPVSVVNLAGNNEGAYAFLPNLRYYESLRPDVALFYTGYNDLSPSNTLVGRSQSPIFRLTGYYPILPLILQEKLLALKYGNVEDGYRASAGGDQKPVFRPSLAHRSTASALEAAIKVNQAVERQLQQLSKVPTAQALSMDVGCGPWNHYCASLFRAVEYALGRGRWAVVVTEPYVGEGHVEQQRVMAAALQARFSHHPKLRYLNLGTAVDLKDPSLCYDGLHLTVQGNERIAEALLSPMLDLLEGEPHAH
jgi:lysophospholipase L1-like esterase